MKKYNLQIQFIMHESDYVSEDFIFTCWEENIETDDLQEAIDLGYKKCKEREYLYFIINEKGNINNRYYDSKKSKSIN